MTSRGGLGSKSRGTLGNSRDTRPIETEEIKVGQSTSDQTIIKKGDITSVGGTATLNNLIVSGTATFNKPNISSSIIRIGTGSATLTASSELSSTYAPSKAFNLSTSADDGWWSDTDSTSYPVWIACEYSENEKIISYKIWTINSYGYHAVVPHSWELRGAVSSTAYDSDDSSTFTVVDSRTNITTSWDQSGVNSFTNDTERKEFDCTNPGEYKYYRLHITDGVSENAQVAIGELAFYKSITKIGKMCIGTGEEPTSGFVGIDSGNGGIDSGNGGKNYGVSIRTTGYGTGVGDDPDGRSYFTTPASTDNARVDINACVLDYEDTAANYRPSLTLRHNGFNSFSLYNHYNTFGNSIRGGGAIFNCPVGILGIAYGGTWRPLRVVGQILATGGYASSDDRIKYNEAPITNALGTINKLKVLKYEKIIWAERYEKGNWIPTDAEWDTVKNSEDSSGERLYHYSTEIGMVAQEVEKIPELAFTVQGDEINAEGNQTPLNMSYSDIFSLAIQALQELDEQLQAEKAKVATLETTVADLVARITALENA